MRLVVRACLVGVVLALVGSACGGGDGPQGLGDDQRSRAAGGFACDPQSIYFAPSLGNGADGPIDAAKGTLVGSPIRLDLEGTYLEERLPGEVYAVLPDGRVMGFVSTIEYQDSTWGPGRAQYCADVEQPTRGG